MLNLQPDRHEVAESAQCLLPPSRVRKAPETARELDRKVDTINQDTQNTVVKQARHRTSTWPSLQYKLWLGISDLPLHYLQDDKRIKTAPRDSQRGHPLTVMWSSSRAVNRPERAVTASTLPSRVGPNTLVSFVHQRNDKKDPPDQMLQLKTLARNPSTTGRCRLHPLKPKKQLIPLNVTHPHPPSFLHTAYHVIHYAVK